MKKTVILFIIFLVNIYSCNSQAKKIDLYNYDIFGFRMNQSFDDILNTLKKEGKKIKIKETSDFIYDSIEYKHIQPKDQDSFEKINVDYNVMFYNNEILLITKYNIQKDYLSNLLKKIDYIEIKHSDEDTKEYRTKNFVIIYQVLNIADAKNQLIIKNSNIQLKIWNKMLMLSPNEVYNVIDKNVKLYSEPSISSDYIRALDKNEKVECWEKGKKDKINGIEGEWLNIETSYQENGWIFSGFAEQYTFDIKYYTITVENLRLRELPDLKGKIIRNLKKDEKVYFIEKGKTDVINSYKGNWVKVKTNDGKIGWCFDGYLLGYTE